jgi:hypothetical protein
MEDDLKENLKWKTIFLFVVEKLEWRPPKNGRGHQEKMEDIIKKMDLKFVLLLNGRQPHFF